VGNWNGTGNITDDPAMHDSLTAINDTLFSCLSFNSPCIDAGHSDTTYFDIEDPQNLGFALWPAMGSLRNDMGAYGGHGSTNILVGVNKGDKKKKNRLSNLNLYQNYPNPFNPITKISWQLPVSCLVNLSIYNITGEKIITLVNRKYPAGFHAIEWVATEFASGVYLYRLEVEDYVETKKMVFMK
jgi:hypothetical protein